MSRVDSAKHSGKSILRVDGSSLVEVLGCFNQNGMIHDFGCGLRLKFSLAMLNWSNLHCPSPRFEEVLSFFNRAFFLLAYRTFSSP